MRKTIVLLDMEQKLIKITDDRYVSFRPYDEKYIEVDVLERKPNGALTIGGQWKRFEDSWGEPAQFWFRKNMLDFLRKNKYYKLSDVKKDLIGYTVKASGWREVSSEQFFATFEGFRIIDYRKGETK